MTGPDRIAPAAPPPAAASRATPDAGPPPPPASPRLWAEFAALFLGVPLALALLLPPSALWPVLGGAMVLGAMLLHVTPGFAWAELLRRPVVPDASVLSLAILATAVAAVLTTLLLLPGALFLLPRHVPELWLMILLLYPIASALPQELLWRVLFFRRYGALFPDPRVALAVNAGVFSLAHLFLWNWVAMVFTAVGGAIFAWAYRDAGPGRLFLWAVLLHAVCGQIIFTVGLGRYFYNGAVQ